MAYKDFSGGLDSGAQSADTTLKLQIDGDHVNLPDASFVRDAAMTRDGMDLVLEGPHGTLVVEGYFAGADAPDLVAPDGSTLTPELVNSFARSPSEYASNASLTDESPVGAVQEITGHATVTHPDGSVETITMGTEIYQGDIIETDAEGAVNIMFADETTFAVSEDARLAIDEYVYDPATQSGETNFSVLKGVFVFTSGLIGRDDPDDVNIETPVGSIGIRGTIIAGNVDTGEITVVEGAIVLRDFGGNEVTLANQFETAKFSTTGGAIEMIGQLSAADVSSRFVTVSNVSPTLFSSISDAAAEQGQPAPNTDGSADQNSDGQVDGTVQTQPEAAPATETGDDGAQLAPQPAPAPVLQTQTSFGANTSGLTTAPIGQPLQPPPGANTGYRSPAPNTAQTHSGDTAALPYIDPATTSPDPSVYNGGTTTTNLAPNHKFSAPPIFFTAMEGQGQWNYHFDMDFHDPEGSPLTFQLDAASIAKLNALTTGSDGVDALMSMPTFGANGNLILYLNTNFAGIADGWNDSFTLSVRAIDAQGVSSGWYDYDFKLLATDAGYANLATNQDLNGITGANIFASNTVDTYDIGPTTASSGNTIHMGGGNDIVEISIGSNNTIYLGEGVNSATIGPNAANLNNKIIGGDQNDNFYIAKADNKLWGMDGDDNFRLAVSDAGFMAELGSANNTLIDGGHSNFRALVKLGDLAAGGTTGLNKYLGWAGDTTMVGGHGDSLVLDGSGTINFSAINDAYFKGIERIDAANSLTNTINLSYSDVVAMTDNHNVLVIKLNGGGDKDTLVFNAEGRSFSKVADNISMDDARAGDTVPPTDFDVYTDGNVTLLIAADEANMGGANIIGL